MGQQQAMIVQNFQTLEKIISLAFSAEAEKPPEVQTKGELKSKFRSIFGGR